MEEEKVKSEKEGFYIPKKALYGIAPSVAIIGVLVSKGDMGPLLLFLIGISAGIIIGRGFFEK